MKILLDECLPVDFRHSFPTHDVHTVQWAGLKGKKNGDLLRAAELLRFHYAPWKSRPLADRSRAGR
jgi:hypothetical protein